MENNFLNSDHIKAEWESNSRWEGIQRNYSADDVVGIRNSLEIKYTLAENGSKKLF